MSRYHLSSPLPAPPFPYRPLVRWAREAEGARRAAVINERIDGIAVIAADVRAIMPAIRAGQRSKLEARLADLAQPVEPGRLEQELVIWLQKLDVEEEIGRATSELQSLMRNSYAVF